MFTVYAMNLTSGRCQAVWKADSQEECRAIIQYAIGTRPDACDYVIVQEGEGNGGTGNRV